MPLYACLFRVNHTLLPLPALCSCHDVTVIIAHQMSSMIIFLGVRAAFGHHFEIGCFVIIIIIVRNLVPICIDHNSSPAFARWNAVARCSEVKDLNCVRFCWTILGMNWTYFKICLIVTLYRGDTPPFVELDLPYTTQVRHQILHELAVSHVPHLKRSIRAGDYFIPIMLKTSDSSSVCT